MSECIDQKVLSTLLSLDPDKVRYASANRAIGEWNLLIIDKLIKDVIDQLPRKLSKVQFDRYIELKKRLSKISQQFKAHNYDQAPISRHIETLSQKLSPFKKEIHPLFEKMFAHTLAKKIMKFDEDVSDIKKEKAQKFISDLLVFFKHYLIPAMYLLKTPEQRLAVHELLKKIIKLKEVLDPLDFERILEKEMIVLVKHFVFNKVTDDHIYYNLLHYQEESLDLSDLALCQEAAISINNYIQKKLIPFLKDPDVFPNQEEIVKIYWSLSNLNRELIHFHSKEGRLLASALQDLEEII